MTDSRGRSRSRSAVLEFSIADVGEAVSAAPDFKAKVTRWQNHPSSTQSQLSIDDINRKLDRARQQRKVCTRPLGRGRLARVRCGRGTAAALRRPTKHLICVCSSLRWTSRLRLLSRTFAARPATRTHSGARTCRVADVGMRRYQSSS